MNKKLTALSLKQPWASLLLLINPETMKAEKAVETRSWKTRFTGELLIHASKAFDEADRELMETEPFKSVFARHGIQSWKDLPTGSIIGGVTMIGCLSTNRKFEIDTVAPAGSNERAFGNYDKDRYGFILIDPWRFQTPIECRGALNFWDVPEPVAAILSDSKFTTAPCISCKGTGKRYMLCSDCDGRGYRPRSLFSLGKPENIVAREEMRV